MRPISRPMTRKEAEEVESFLIQRYQRQHGGNPPRYNERKTYTPTRVKSDFISDFVFGEERLKRRTKRESLWNFIYGEEKRGRRTKKKSDAVSGFNFEKWDSDFRKWDFGFGEERRRNKRKKKSDEWSLF